MTFTRPSMTYPVVMQVAVFGGTFDPPHVAHLTVGEAAYHQLDVEVVLFVPAGEPWQKDGRSVAPARHRLEMVRLAVEGVPYFGIDDREVRRGGPSYTIETVDEMREEGLEPILVMGADAAASMITWRRAERLADVRVAVVARPGVERKSVIEGVVGELTWLDAPSLELSGTELRDRSAEGYSLRFIVPDAVCSYIEREQVYGR